MSNKHMVLVDAGALQMVRNALKRDAESGNQARAEMLDELDKATTQQDRAAFDQFASQATTTLHVICEIADNNNPASVMHDDPRKALEQIEVLALGVQAQTRDEVIELAESLETRRILEEIKVVAALHPLDDMPTPYQAAWRACCEEIFYRATRYRWHMDEDARRFTRAANDAGV